jgi:hypothetical protein
MKRIFRKELVVILLFFVAILSPAVDMLLKLDKVEHLNENRLLALHKLFQ